MDRKTIIRIAQLYYNEDLTQQEIADLMGLSRITISTLLKKAREMGIIQIHVIPDEVETVEELEKALAGRFGLKQAVVVQCPPGPEDQIKKHIGMAGARFLERTLKDGDTLACSWGRTLWETASFIKPGNLRINVVQLNGGLGQISDKSLPTELAKHLAHVFGGSYYYLHAPGIVGNPGIKDALLSDSAIQGTISRAKAATVAACGIGSIINSALVEFGCISAGQLDQLRALGVVGDICLRFFGRDGRLRRSELDERIIGLSAEDLRAIPCVVGIAGGPSKHEALQGALRSGLLNAVVTDAESARAVLNTE